VLGGRDPPRSTTGGGLLTAGWGAQDSGARRAVAGVPATHCSILQHTSARCNSLQEKPGAQDSAAQRAVAVVAATHWRRHSILQHMQHTAAHCNTLQHTATCAQHVEWWWTTRCCRFHCIILQHHAKHCDALKLTATHCNALQRTAAHCEHCDTMEHESGVG